MSAFNGEPFQEFLKRHNISSPPCYSGVGQGWIPILDELVEKLTKLGWDKQFAQVKEKFGTLRVYLETYPPEHREEYYALIRDAEERSATVCEDCGKPGKIRRERGWHRTLCDECNATQDERHKEAMKNWCKSL